MGPMRNSRFLVFLLFISAACWAQTYTIATVAPTSTTGAVLGPTGLALDSAGNLYVADTFGAIRKITPGGSISTVAGSYSASGFGGDGGPATQAMLLSPAGVAVDSSGNIYITDLGNNRVRKINPSGVISTIAGGGTGSGEGVAATSVALSAPTGIAVDGAGNVYFTEGGLNSSRVRKIATNGTISTVAGNGTMGYSGDGGQATSASLNTPSGVAIDTSGNIFIADGGNQRVRKVTPAGVISTVAGNGTLGYGGDGGPATGAELNVPTGVAVDGSGNLFITDPGNERIRMLSASGVISTVAGNGTLGITGDGGAATSAEINSPFGIAVGGAGKVYFSEGGAGSVRVITPGQASGGAPAIQPGGVVSAGAFGGLTTVAPGSWIEIYGANLAPDTNTWGAYFSGVNAPTAIDGVKVTVGGQPAFLDFISPGQVNAQVPSTVPSGAQPVVLTNAAGTSAAISILVSAESPGLLAPSSFIVGGKQYAAGIFADGTYTAPPGSIAGVASRRAKTGDVITFYGVGFGPVTPSIPAGQTVQQTNALASNFHFFIGGTEASVTYDGLVYGSIGLYQINAVVPSVGNSDLVPVTFTLAGAPGSQTLYIPVQN
jgi:uncharacterized protein (TIGR03437 family)